MHETTQDDAVTLRQLRRVLELTEEAVTARRTAAAQPPAPTRAQAPAPQNSDLPDPLDEVEARVAFGEVESALTTLRAYLDARPTVRAYTLLASIERGEGRLDAAHRAAEQAVGRAAEELARARCEQGRVLVDAGRLDDARGRFEQAHESAPIVDALVGLGSLALSAGSTEEAESFFRRALEGEKSARTLSGLGLALIARGQARQAFEPLEQALDIEADCASAVYGIVQAAFQTGDLRSAERRVGAYLELHGGNLDMAFTLAGLRQQLGDLDGTHEMIERIELFDPQYPGLTELRAKLG